MPGRNHTLVWGIGSTISWSRVPVSRYPGFEFRVQGLGLGVSGWAANPQDLAIGGAPSGLRFRGRPGPGGSPGLLRVPFRHCDPQHSFCDPQNLAVRPPKSNMRPPKYGNGRGTWLFEMSRDVRSRRLPRSSGRYLVKGFRFSFYFSCAQRRHFSRFKDSGFGFGIQLLFALTVWLSAGFRIQVVEGLLVVLASMTLGKPPNPQPQILNFKP